MNVFRLTCQRFFGVVHKKYTSVRLKPNKSLPGFNKIILIATLPVIPSLPSQNVSNEKNDNSVNTKSVSDIKENKGPAVEDIKEVESPWDRVWAMYKRDEYGNLSKEITATLHSCYMATFIGFVYGGTLTSRRAFIDFMERNQATIFEHPIDAKRKLQNHVSIHFGKGAFYWAWRLTLFTGLYMLTFTSIHRYRGSTSLVDYSLGGAATGALLRIKLGIPGIIIGAAVGGVLGFVSGLSTQTMLNLYGTSIDEIMAFNYEMDKDRNMQMELLLKERFEQSDEMPKEALERLKVHEQIDTKL